MQESFLNKIALLPNFSEMHEDIQCLVHVHFLPLMSRPSTNRLNVFSNVCNLILKTNHTDNFPLSFSVLFFSNPGSLQTSDWLAFPFSSVVLSQLGSAENRPEQSLPQQRFQLFSAFQQQQQQIQVIQQLHSDYLLDTLLQKYLKKTLVLLSFKTK